MLRDDRDHSPSIMGCHERQEGVSNSPAESQGHEEFSYGILHCARGKEKWDQRRWRWQQGGDSDSPKSPLPENPVNLGERPDRELAFERFFSPFASKPVGDEASDYRTNRRHQRIIKP